MKKIIILIMLLLLMSSCSKKAGSTSSKIRIVSGNIQALMSSKANNGLLLYGKSADGKTFTKGITGDSIDLVFPNGVWNFYAISWEVTDKASGTLPDFNGKTYCGKLLAQNLNGTDVNLTLNMTNSSCDDADFSAHTKVNTFNSISEVVFPKPNLFSCKDLAPVKNESAVAAQISKCDQTETAKFNKGYHTSYKIVAYEYKKFGPTNEVGPAKIFESACLLSNNSSTAGGIDPGGLTASNFYDVKIPVSSGNGLAIAVEAYYSSPNLDGSPNGCNPSRGFDVFPLSGNASTASAYLDDTTGYYSNTYNFFIPSSEADVCKAPRLDNVLAAGYGTAGSPYAICTKTQLENLRSNLTFYSNKSFDLLTDIDYGMAKIPPFGDDLTYGGADPNTIQSYTDAVFDGRKHKISNFIIDCKIPNNLSGTNSIANNRIGFFRSINNATVKNISFDRAVIMCDGGGNKMGALAGEITGTSVLKNIKVNAKISGNDYIGGIAGNINGASINASQIHSKGDISGNHRVGGLFGSVTTNGAAPSTLDRVSFFGVINGVLSNNGNFPTDHQDVGGIIGFASGTANAYLYLKEAIVKSERIEGAQNNGGFIGQTSYVSLSDSYVEANQISNPKTAVSSINMGGAIGLAGVSTSLNNIAALNGLRISNRIFTSVNGTLATSDHTLGGLVGDASIATCYTSYFTGENDLSNAACGTSIANSILSKTQSTYSGFNFSTSSPFMWTMPDGTNDIPRLAFESAIENEVPYLKRECSGHYSSQAGTGTLLNPKWICNYSQFQNMTSDQTSFYELKKNIRYEGTTVYVPLAPGVYKLKGNQFGLYNFYINGNHSTDANHYEQGIFSILNPDSIISDLKIFNANLSPITISGNLSSGILAGVNFGDVKNISVFLSKAEYTTPSTASGNIRFGGLIGENIGFVSKAILEMKTAVSGSSFPTGNFLSAGGVVGSNIGTIEAVESFASLLRFGLCSSVSNFQFPSQEHLGTFAGENNIVTGGPIGTIREVASHGAFEVKANLVSGICSNLPVRGPNSHISTFVARNAGTISDFLADPYYSFSLSSTMMSSPAPEILAYNTGTVERGFVKFQNADANKIMTQNHTQIYTMPSTTTCSISDIGKYYVSATSVAFSSFGPLSTSDIIMCDGVSNVLLPYGSALYSSIMTAKSDVFYFANSAPMGNTAISPYSGRFSDGSLIFSLPNGNFQFEVGTINIPLSSSWSVATDYLNPTNHTWMVELWDNETFNTDIPRLVKLNFKPDDFGSPL